MVQEDPDTPVKVETSHKHGVKEQSKSPVGAVRPRVIRERSPLSRAELSGVSPTPVVSSPMTGPDRRGPDLKRALWNDRDSQGRTQVRENCCGIFQVECLAKQ